MRNVHNIMSVGQVPVASVGYVPLDSECKSLVFNLHLLEYSRVLV